MWTHSFTSGVRGVNANPCQPKHLIPITAKEVLIGAFGSFPQPDKVGRESGLTQQYKRRRDFPGSTAYGLSKKHTVRTVT